LRVAYGVFEEFSAEDLLEEDPKSYEEGWWFFFEWDDCEGWCFDHFFFFWESSTSSTSSFVGACLAEGVVVIICYESCFA
jgi:hypothetical protein